MDSGGWAGAFVRSGIAPTVFDVLPGAATAVRAWLGRQSCGTAWSRDPHVPALDAWAVLDGGVLAVACTDPGATGLTSGFHVVGFGAFRLLTTELGLDRPTRPVPGEPPYDAGALRRAHAARPAGSPDAQEQADMLASCTDARTLRWVAGALAAAAVPLAPPLGA